MLPVFESSTGLICDSFESSITDIDQRICPTVMQQSAYVTSEECEDAFRSLKRPNSCLPALSALRQCKTRFATRRDH